MLVFISGEFRKNLTSLSRLFAADRRFQFQKRSQLVIRVNNEALFVVEVASPDWVTLLLSSKHFNHKVRSP